jgi:hypothetical protein
MLPNGYKTVKRITHSPPAKLVKTNSKHITTAFSSNPETYKHQKEK